MNPGRRSGGRRNANQGEGGVGGAIADEVIESGVEAGIGGLFRVVRSVGGFLFDITFGLIGKVIGGIFRLIFSIFGD